MQEPVIRHLWIHLLVMVVLLQWGLWILAMLFSADHDVIMDHRGRADMADTSHSVGQSITSIPAT